MKTKRLFIYSWDLGTIACILAETQDSKAERGGEDLQWNKMQSPGTLREAAGHT